ncbi:MAG TPA: lamin tail domain-containing protein, partial [Candidatus Cloacimonadota bacterium]|nr:lamin tail domain-containing protein [Candidatus Cloacimonadota bacterium]
MIKKVLGTVILLGFITMMFAQAQTLFFSEYLEGSSNNKAIEIFNGTGAAVDLSQYSVKLGSNGNEWSTTNSVNLSGTLANNDVYVIANSQAIAAIQDVADLTHTVTYFNGNDCLGLFQGDTMIDIIGVYMNNPGTAWDVAGVTGATLNHTLIRKPEVTQGNTDWTSSAGTNADNSEW